MKLTYNSNYGLLASVTYDCLAYISEARIPDGKGGHLRLKTTNGTPRIKPCMHLLGFETRFLSSGDIILSEEKEVKHRIPSVLVRHPEKLYEVQFVKLYAGMLRETYSPPDALHSWLQNISFDDNIVHVVNGKESYNVADFGNDY